MLLILFFLIFIFNLIPVFTPPTWMLLSYIQITYHPQLLALAFTGAAAATSGRLLLAKLASVIVRDRFLGKNTILNLDSVKNRLAQHRTLTFNIFLFYAFSPLPSNQLFLAYGLTNLNVGLIALPFFIGRFVSYLFWIAMASRIAHIVAAQALLSGTFVKSYFLVVQILTIVSVYVFTKIDWQKLFTEKRFSFIKK